MLLNIIIFIDIEEGGMRIEDFSKYLRDYKVDDILEKKPRYLFIFESPHTDELENKCPVCGATGKRLQNILGLIVRMDLVKL